MVDDQHLRSFDRWYGVRTSGHVELRDTSFDPARLRDATAYGPVNAWALRKLFTTLNLPASLAFVDLGSGMGRACLIAAEYGFERVTGVELASELCQVARANVAHRYLPGNGKQAINIVEGDVLDYCDHSTDDVFFVYSAFSLDFLRAVLAKLVIRATQQDKAVTVIYTERLSWPRSSAVSALAEHGAFQKVHENCSWGQAFFVYRCIPRH
jgi:SAM-dependent methyltransferase